MSNKLIDGVLIDCSRTMERHEYYFKLIDFMAEWGLNTLFFHFTDDHGCAVQLPGFPRLEMKHAFTLPEIKKLIRYAAKKKIDIVPELETFGHSRYLTDKKKYSYLYAGGKTNILNFNAIDPLSYDTIMVMKKLIGTVVKIFPSKYLHIGCDEVNLKEYCLIKGGLDEASVWTNYVNKIIQITKETGKIPMMWADHPSTNPKIAELLRKDVIVVQWDYEGNTREKYFKFLKKAGFKEIISAPSIACNAYRFLPSVTGIKNVVNMSKFAAKYKLNGMVNTIWCPYRYVQGSMYYGIAFGAYSLRAKGKGKLAEFNKVFAEKVFGTSKDGNINEFLKNYSKFEVYNVLVGELFGIKAKWVKVKDVHKKTMREINEIGRDLLSKAEYVAPEKNREIWDAMLLALKCSWIFSEHYVITKGKAKNKNRIKEYKKMLGTVTKQVSDDWDKNRFPDDPQKFGGRFANEANSYMMLILQELKKI